MQQAKTALITGASGGIGYELAKLFARDHYNLVLVARSQTQLESVAKELTDKHGVTVKVIVKDLAVADSPREIFTELEQQGTQIDVLVNNAGYASFGLFAEADLTTELNMMQVNMVALTHLTGLFLPGMMQRHTGKLLNVASTAAFQPGPLMAVYYASKAFVLSFSEALANELQHTGVTITALCPGATASGFQKRANMVESKLVRGKIMDAQTVAKAGYRGLMANKTVVIPGLRHRMLAFSVRLTPRKIVTSFVRNLQEKA